MVVSSKFGREMLVYCLLWLWVGGWWVVMGCKVAICIHVYVFPQPWKANPTYRYACGRIAAHWTQIWPALNVHKIDNDIFRWIFVVSLKFVPEGRLDYKTISEWTSGQASCDLNRLWTVHCHKCISDPIKLTVYRFTNIHIHTSKNVKIS